MQAYFGERAHALLIARAPSWIETGKRRKGVQGSRDEAKREVTGEGEGKEKYACQQSLVVQ